MKNIILFAITVALSPWSNLPTQEFKKEAAAFQEEAESYYHLQALLAKEYAKKASSKILQKFQNSFSHIRSIDFIEKKDHDLIGWTATEKDLSTGETLGLCISPVYDAKKKVLLGYLVGKYRFQTHLKTSTITPIDGKAPRLHEKLKYSHSLIILPSF